MDNKHTISDLQRLQTLPWEQKVLISQTRIMEWFQWITSV